MSLGRREREEGAKLDAGNAGVGLCWGIPPPEALEALRCGPGGAQPQQGRYPVPWDVWWGGPGPCRVGSGVQIHESRPSVTQAEGQASGMYGSQFLPCRILTGCLRGTAAS